MPHITSVIDSHGPIIPVHIFISEQRGEALRKAGMPIPQPIACNLLIDTGASCTCIDSAIIKSLGIPSTGNISLHTPSTGSMAHSAKTYDISMYILGSEQQPKIINAIQVVECYFGSQALHGLLGRDILASSRLIYSGHDKLVMLSIM